MMPALLLLTLASEPQWTFATETLGYLQGRYGVQIEHALGAHDSLEAYGFYLASESTGHANLFRGLETLDTHTRAGGLDLQYRWYFATGRPVEGAFVGPSLELSSYHVRTKGDEHGEASFETFTYAGGACDVGGQAVVGPGLVLGASFGLRYRAVIAGEYEDRDHPLGWSFSHAPGLGLRFRFWVGWAL